MRVVDDLKPHNLEAFQEINGMIESGTKKIAIPRATGSGKTYLLGALAEKYNNDRKLVLEPSRPLLNDIQEKFDEFGIENTDFITYQKLTRMSDEDIAAMDYKVIFLDEFHHGTAPKWGEKIEVLMAAHPDSIICGTSATTVRCDGVNVVDALFDGNAIDELSLSTAIAKKVLPCPTYVTAIYRLDDELDKLKKKVEKSTNTKEEKKEFLEKMQVMKNHFEKSYGVPTILNKYIKVKNGKYLVFCKDKEHLDTMRDVVIDWFRVAGIKNIHSYAVYSDYPDKEKDYNDFLEDNTESLRLLFSINMLNEGVHIENISGVMMLRTTMSDIVYRQQLGRVLETGNLDKYLVVFDFVNNFSSTGDGVGLLKEIKDAVAKEKESDPHFDDSGFEDIDTFFVLENVLEIQEMFAEIEGRLQGSWDLYIKALKQYKEREGDCDVSSKHFEIVDGVSLWLGNWCCYTRSVKNGNVRGFLTNEMECQLCELGFIWDTVRYRFENKVKGVAEYYKENGKYPSPKTKDLKVRKLGEFLLNEKTKMRNEKEKYSKWKKEIILKHLSDFSCDTRSEKIFNEFIYYVGLYKERYGHVDIKRSDVIDGFNIGRKLGNIKNAYNKKRLPYDKMKQISNLGIYLENTHEKQFSEKMELAKKAVKNGVIISSTNQIYEGKNLSQWIQRIVKKKYKNDELSFEEKKIIESLTGKTFEDMFKEKVYEKKFVLCKQAINEGVILTNSHKVYKGVDLVNWIRNHEKQFSDEELKVVHQLMPPTTIYLWLIPLTASKELPILLLKLLE